jgi:hypothetical protein
VICTATEGFDQSSMSARDKSGMSMNLLRFHRPKIRWDKSSIPTLKQESKEFVFDDASFWLNNATTDPWISSAVFEIWLHTVHQDSKLKFLDLGLRLCL